MSPARCVVEFPDGHIGAPGFEQLLSPAGQGTIRILDVEFVVKDATGAARRVEASELGNPDGTDLIVWAGASCGLLDQADVALVVAR